MFSRSSSRSTSTFDFGTLFDPESSASKEHWGHIQCNCGHRADESLEEARTQGRIHLNGRCTWSCCGANWSDMECKKPTSKPKESPKPSSEKEESDKAGDKQRKADFEREAKKLRRCLPVFYTQELVCLCCYQPYTDPVRLACGHTFCRECLQKSVAYQQAAASFTAKYRATPTVGAGASAQAESEQSKADRLGRLQLRQMTRTQRRELALLSAGGPAAAAAAADAPAQPAAAAAAAPSEEEDSKEAIICPVCSECSLVRLATADEQIGARVRELRERQARGTRPLCSFCESAVRAGAQDAAEEAPLVCATCGPVCRRHHELLHVAGPPTFRCHDVSEQPMLLLPVLDSIPRQYDICAKHCCEMDLYDTVLDQPLCEVCAAAYARHGNSDRIIREEDVMAYRIKREAELSSKRQSEERARLLTEESQKRAVEQQKEREIAKIHELQHMLEERVRAYRDVLAKSQGIHAAGMLTTAADGVGKLRDDVRQLFDQNRAYLDEMQRSVEADIDKALADADKQLCARYAASQTLLDDAQATLARTTGVPLDTEFVRGMLSARLHAAYNALDNVGKLPTAPQSVESLLDIKRDPTAAKSCHILTVAPNAAFFGAPESGSGAEAEKDAAAAAAAAGGEKDEDKMDDKELLAKIRKQLEEEDRKNSERVRRENQRFGTLRSVVSSDMSDEMKCQQIGSVIFERGEQVLGGGAGLEDVFAVSQLFFEHNSIDRIMRDLSAPADFHRELRAIYALIKHKEKRGK